MPEKSYSKIKPRIHSPTIRSGTIPAYAELQVSSNFSFLRGASHPQELISTAGALGYHAIGVTDLNSLAGVVRAHTAAKESKVAFLVGAKLELALITPNQSDPAVCEAIQVLVYPISRVGYGNLCRLLTIGKRRVEKGDCLLSPEDFFAHQKDLISILVPPLAEAHKASLSQHTFHKMCHLFRERYLSPETLSIACTRNYQHNGVAHGAKVQELAQGFAIPLVATNDVYYHVKERRALQDVLTCIREKCTIQEAGQRLFQNGERYLKTPEEMQRLFRDLPEALSRTMVLAEMASGFSLDELRYEYPVEICPNGKTPLEYLTARTWEGALQRYQGTVPEKVRHTIEEELCLIEELKYEKYFLTCYDIVRFARSKEILCQGRGAAANSAVCYCLGITSVDPDKIDLLFARFVSKERNEPPDIDIDFEHERREEVIQYIYQKYGRDRAGLTCEVVSYRQRSAIREVGKALGLSLQIVDKLAKSIHRWSDCALTDKELRGAGLNPIDPTIRNALALSNELLGFPRHLSQHVGGFIISQRPLCETVPILNASMPERTIIEWDKDDIEELGMLKIDVLGLGMLSCVRKALQIINARRVKEGHATLEMYSIPQDDTSVYDMICEADTVGVFQIESRAQMSMLPRLKPRVFYDLVIEVSIVRPGPIQGNMVHPYLRRRNGLEPEYYPDERVKRILGKTLGVPLFQEQAMRLVIELANFTPGEAEQLRRSIAAWKTDKTLIAKFRNKIVDGMLQCGYTEKFADTCMTQIQGFSEYGFPESHAASFALIAYVSAWIKKHYPAEFATALLNSQPMGFYAPSQIVRDAAAHGVAVYPVDVLHSAWDCTLEPLRPDPSEYTALHQQVKEPRHATALRLGMRLVKGLPEKEVAVITHAIQEHGHFGSIEALWRAVRSTSSEQRVRKASMHLLARADAFGSFHLSRRAAVWEVQALHEEVLTLDSLPGVTARLPRKEVILPRLTAQQEMFQDYAATGLSLKGHPLNFIREELTKRGVSTATTLKHLPSKLFSGATRPVAAVAGIAIIRQRPGTAKGVVFITIEDETGVTNLIIRPQIFARYEKVILLASCILARGKLERVGEVVYVNAETLENVDSLVLSAHPQIGSALPNNSYSY